MALTSLEIANAQNSLVVLKNVLTQTCSPSLDVRQEIRSETGLSDETIKSWFKAKRRKFIHFSTRKIKKPLKEEPVCDEGVNHENSRRNLFKAQNSIPLVHPERMSLHKGRPCPIATK
jgi:hypothetical protein